MQSSQAAVITRSLGHAEFIANHPIPSLRDDDILIRTAAVALNPIDWMLCESTPSVNAVMGHDYAGTVIAAGKSVREMYKNGDRVCGLVKGADNTRPESGTYAEYIVAKAAIQMRIPDDVAFEDAATVGVGATTAGQCLFGPSCLKLQWPGNQSHSQSRETILIYGGSTASGSWMIQFAKLAGYTVLTTCSAKNFDLVRHYGADAVFDYHSPRCAQMIREHTNSTLRIVCDTVATQDSTCICEEVISDEGGLYHSLLPAQMRRTDVKMTFMNCCTAIGEEFEYGPECMKIPSMPSEFEFAKRWTGIVSILWSQGKLKTPVVEKRDGGLRNVLDGLKDLKNGSVSGRKLVYPVLGN
ncbi:zinc-binding alcohol dehydrogenase family protein [Aspergillus clavatus NRRL 1]|uniref:Oxidoreductase, zinc-binding dehydrogenase family, putative n=1 Tax=Aspergillus clavatus (strain ATCC 1007 / CBS 513.65 / DSM 816 / NCTC 3887 / NRRL 1 / QM 1276 / 107) TaxID=344612 RepID=A1CLL0_ASPCL|nr:oxidoreductase, zinc-binding dehydrogenase family, putative [Aspergillus clavatus NRRL 1]EAW10034.1 oxidoreductase, zinc-binding dehydrogenase family, putative [Aspergillus clavatus NRRL 1]